MNISCFSPRSDRSRGFTLIELMLATALALILLGTLVKIIAMVNTSFARTRVLIDLQNRCRNTQILLQQDLNHVSVTPKAPRPVEMDDGYLCAGTISSNLTRDNNRLNRNDDSARFDTDLIDDCNFVAFTVFNRENSFSFMDPNNSSRTLQTPYAEVVWFVYRNDLYRIAVPYVNNPNTAISYTVQSGGVNSISGLNAYGASGSRIPYVRMISSGALGDFPNRILNYGTSAGSFIWDKIKDKNSSSTSGSISYEQLQNYMVMQNVIMFKVQVYDPWEKRYYNINEMKTGTSSYYNRKAFRYASSAVNSTNTSVYYDSGSTLSYVSSNTDTSSALQTPDSANNSVVCSNTRLFDPRTPSDSNDFYQPPTESFLPGMRILIRAFDSDSGTIREFRVGAEFRTR